mmetsp:Transcript_9256/g.12127  ORF Transcript_9256/g.12127 Transcript_9256/m.12127 type:complete len:327 (+) Transcript_9256:191-1171(+)
MVSINKNTEVKSNPIFIVDDNDDDGNIEYGENDEDDNNSSNIQFQAGRANDSSSATEKRLFKREREQKSLELLKHFDNCVFDDQLLSRVTLQWSKTLRTTAGRCIQKRSKQTANERSAVIELATKVLDNEQRLAETLLHELCHAAVWIIEGVSRPPHGDAFQRWGTRALLVTGLPVTTCHNYEISYKHQWICVGSKKNNNLGQGCGATIGRHSKSIDVARQVCGKCKGKLEYKGNPSQLNAGGEAKEQPPFAKYVKDNYKHAKLAVQQYKRSQFTAKGSPRQRAPSPSSPLPPVAHTEVMRHLSTQWKARFDVDGNLDSDFDRSDH